MWQFSNLWPELSSTSMPNSHVLAVSRGHSLAIEWSCLFEFIKGVGGKEIKCEACRAFYLFFATSLINSIIQEHECQILSIIIK